MWVAEVLSRMWAAGCLGVCVVHVIAWFSVIRWLKELKGLLAFCGTDMKSIIGHAFLASALFSCTTTREQEKNALFI